MKTQVLVVAPDRVSDGNLGITFDVMRAAVRIQEAGLAGRPSDLDLTLRVVGVGGRSVTTAAGRKFLLDGKLPQRPALGPRDLVIVPGIGRSTPEAIERAFADGGFDPIFDFLRRAASTRATLAASCTGTFVLAESGLLDGREATTTWWLAPFFRERYPAVALSADRAVVASGSLVTAGASFAHADLMLVLLAHVAGPLLAQQVARYLLLEPRPSPSREMVVQHLRIGDPILRALEQFVLGNLGRPITLADLSRAAHASPRTLARHVEHVLGTSPMRFVQRLRAEHAAYLLRTTDAPVETIAERVGYLEPAALRRLLRRVLDASPRDLRGARAARQRQPSFLHGV
jgi:transcriptional regulator GlxA family with amidase domain